MKYYAMCFLLLAFLYALSWCICVGLIWLISLCLPWEFNLLNATGIWLVLCLIKLIFPNKIGGGDDG